MQLAMFRVPVCVGHGTGPRIIGCGGRLMALLATALSFLLRTEVMLSVLVLLNRGRLKLTFVSVFLRLMTGLVCGGVCCGGGGPCLTIRRGGGRLMCRIWTVALLTLLLRPCPSVRAPTMTIVVSMSSSVVVVLVVLDSCVCSVLLTVTVVTGLVRVGSGDCCDVDASGIGGVGSADDSDEMFGWYDSTGYDEYVSAG